MITTPVAATLAKATSPSPLCQRISLGWAVAVASITLDVAVDLARTGDVWLFCGHTMAGRAIQVATNTPVNHVGMSVAVEDLPPLMWHARLGRALTDVSAGARHRGSSCMTCARRSSSGLPGMVSGRGCASWVLR
jgi:hypothetical protein